MPYGTMLPFDKRKAMENMTPSRITRRSFLNRCSAFSADILAATQILPTGAFGADAPGNKLNVACIGMGRHGR